MGPKVEIEEVHSSNVELVIRVEVRDGVTSKEVVKWLQTIAAPGSSFQIHVVSSATSAISATRASRAYYPRPPSSNGGCCE